VAGSKTPLSIAFGLSVRRLREEHHLSQEELAHRTGLHRNHVGEIERGEANPTLKTVDVIARALDLSASELIARSEALEKKR
jgi:transcriptional regulator with XRE-family HTH domain